MIQATCPVPRGRTLRVLLLASLWLACACATARPAAAAPDGKGAPRPSVLMAVRIDSKVKGRTIALRPVIITASGTRGTIRVGETSGMRPTPAPRTPRAPFLATVALEPTILEGTTPRMIRLKIEFLMDNNGRTLKKSFTTTVVSEQPWSFEYDDPDLGETCKLEITATAVGADEEVVRDAATGKHVVRRRSHP